jgi:syntaxin 1B/2/3
MGTIIAQQEETIIYIEEKARQVEQDTHIACVISVEITLVQGSHLFPSLQHTEDATRFALSARQKRWICFFIVVVALCIVALVLGLLFNAGKIFTKKKAH